MSVGRRVVRDDLHWGDTLERAAGLDIPPGQRVDRDRFNLGKKWRLDVAVQQARDDGDRCPGAPLRRVDDEAGIGDHAAGARAARDQDALRQPDVGGDINPVVDLLLRAEGFRHLDDVIGGASQRGRDVVQPAHLVAAAVGQRGIGRRRDAVRTVVLRRDPLIVRHNQIPVPPPEVAHAQRDILAQLVLQARRELPVVSADRPRVVAQARLGDRGAEVGILNRGALAVRAEIDEIALRQEIAVQVAPHPSGTRPGAPRGIGPARKNVDVRPFQVLADARFHGRLAVAKQVVRATKPRTDVLPVWDVVDRVEPGVARRHQRARIQLVHGHIHILVIVPHAVVERQTLHRPLILAEHAHVRLHRLLECLRDRVHRHLTRLAIQELQRHAVRAELERVEVARVVEGESRFCRMRAGDVGHRDARVVLIAVVEPNGLAPLPPREAGAVLRVRILVPRCNSLITCMAQRPGPPLDEVPLGERGAGLEQQPARHRGAPRHL